MSWLKVPTTLASLQFALSPRMRSGGGQCRHFPSEISPPLLHCPNWRRLPRMHLLSSAGWPLGSTPVNHAFSWHCSFWTQTGRCERSLREESRLCTWVHLCAFMAANSISRPSSILMQTSGWIATMYVRGKAPGRPTQTKTPNMYQEQTKHHFLFVLIIKEWFDDRCNVTFWTYRSLGVIYEESVVVMEDGCDEALKADKRAERM